MVGGGRRRLLTKSWLSGRAAGGHRSGSHANQVLFDSAHTAGGGKEAVESCFPPNLLLHHGCYLQSGSLSTEETDKGVHRNFAWPPEHKTPCARFALVQLPSQSTFSRAQHAVTQAVSFPATASYFLVNGLPLIANGSRTGQTPGGC